MTHDTARKRTFLVAGLQSSGKSTFLAALWHIATNDDGNEQGLSVVDFRGERGYVQQLETSWVQGEVVPHTRRAADNRVELVLNGASLSGPISLTLPDLSGEDFRAYFANREWPSSLDEFVQAIDGILLFVNPLTLVQPRPLSEVLAIEDSISLDRQSDDIVREASAVDPTPWDPQRAPCSVVLVDLLATITNRRGRRADPLRVAVIVSAWDTMEGAQVEPARWFQRDVALLDQYIRSNPRLFEVEVFGVSAQGGDILDPSVRETLLQQANPTDRVRITCNGKIDSDLTRPLSWLLEDEALT